MAPEKPTLGTFVLVVVIVLVGFVYLSELLGYVFGLFDTAMDITPRASNDPFTVLTTLFSYVYDWSKSVLTNPLGLAVILFISLVLLAFEVKWR